MKVATYLLPLAGLLSSVLSAPVRTRVKCHPSTTIASSTSALTTVTGYYHVDAPQTPPAPTTTSVPTTTPVSIASTTPEPVISTTPEPATSTTPAPITSTTPAPAVNVKYSKSSSQSDSGLNEQLMLELVNAERAKQGLSALVINPALSKMALDQCQHQKSIEKMTHDNPAGSMLSRAAKAGVKLSGVAENVFAGVKSEQEAVDGWMASPGHKANILGNYNAMGVARVGIYWTQNFGFVL
ncbi:hypothetical protein IWQ60_005569 [Tieghemiomyces parasiticus]|uniref:SCP domain-containing protein n=1 Tax=Tieghemiomyces parasiticus TaxID=78921 RepID=A0A9W8A8W7_9FUNG|nr:hypothetical protein IWQ60_005569 [Tieghemiomyces parasiticus]